MEARAAVGRLHAPHYPLKEALEIEESDIQHEGKKQDDKKDLRAFKESEGQWFAPDFFNGSKRHVSAIENGYGQ